MFDLSCLQHFLIPGCRAAAQEDAGIQCSIKNHQFPENIERVPSVKADRSIPALHETVTEEVRTWSSPDPDPAERPCYCWKN